MFPLADHKFNILKSQFAISSRNWGGRRSPPLVFTEQGVAMLSAVLKSERAIDVNIAIMRAFVRMRQVLSSNSQLEKKMVVLESKYDRKFKSFYGHPKVDVRARRSEKKDYWTRKNGRLNLNFFAMNARLNEKNSR